MLKFLSVLISLFLVNINTVFASMPSYPDDEEYIGCVRATNDYNGCADKQMKREMEIVKKQYRVIIANPNIIGWREDIAENTATIRDMWESWTAFRIRFCSLSSKARKYMEELFDAKISCNSYYTTHHRDHLDKIILLLTGKVPANRENFPYLEIDEHDEEYEQCMEGKDTSKCLVEELERSTKQIKNLYKTASEDEMIGKWNNGPDLKNGNYRDMYDSWIAYRNRICSLSVWAYNKSYGDQGADLTQCLQFFNMEMLEMMRKTLENAYSVLDEDIMPDDDDGGEAEGKTIKPLERRFDTEQNKDEVLEADEEVKSAAAEEESEKTTPKKKVNVPSWAQQ